MALRCTAALALLCYASLLHFAVGVLLYRRSAIPGTRIQLQEVDDPGEHVAEWWDIAPSENRENPFAIVLANTDLVPVCEHPLQTRLANKHKLGGEP